jgi:hypothetical protein
MKLAAPRIIGLCAVLAGCEAQGVSIGTEELCIKDARLVAAERPSQAEPVSSCAVVGENQLANPGFEAPIVSSSCEPTGRFCQFPAAELGGWSTSSEEQVIELWGDGHMSVGAPEDSQFAELNARSRDTLYQDLALPPGQLMLWSLMHRGRDGIDSIELQLGPPEALVIEATVSSPEDAWHSESGLYRVADDEVLTRFALVSRSGEAEGNLVDAVVFAPVN